MPERTAHPSDVQSPARQVRRTCLIVDDSRVVRGLSRRAVESVGFEVSEAENGKEGLARCARSLPDLILLDWNMPVMTGLEFISHLRASAGGQAPRVLFCTTETDPLIIGKGMSAGADGFVAKPFDDATLLAKLERIGAF